MAFFEDARPAPEEKEKPYYEITTVDGKEWPHEPGCTIEAVPVGNTAHYVVKDSKGKIDGMYPFSSVSCVQLYDPEDESA